MRLREFKKLFLSDGAYFPWSGNHAPDLVDVFLRSGNHHPDSVGDFPWSGFRVLDPGDDFPGSESLCTCL